MKFLRKNLAFVFTLAFMLTCAFVLGQDSIDTLPVPEIGLGPDTYVDVGAFGAGIEWVYGIIIVVAGYLSYLIPGLKNISSGVYRVAAVAVVVGAGFLVFDAGSSLLSLIITYTVSTSFYEVFLKLFKKSPKAEA